MTGDPKRVVPFGINYEKGKKVIEYSWSNFVAPACDACNNRYAEMESRMKPIIEGLQRRETLPVHAYVELLDWLDKVRVGVWLVRHMIEKHPINITPNFHIDTRIGQKDRMVAVSVFDSGNRGINLFGADSLIFNDMPSCFGLRINDILLLNVSADFFCSKGCGFPYPETMLLQMGGDEDGKMVLQDFRTPTGFEHPLTRLKLFKPVVWLYQPVKLPTWDPVFQGGFVGHTSMFDSRIAAMTLEGNERYGALFRQFSDRVHVHRSLSDAIEFDEVIGGDSAMQKDIAASVYDCQVRLFKAVNYRWFDRERKRGFAKLYRKLKLPARRLPLPYLSRRARMHALLPGRRATRSRLIKTTNTPLFMRQHHPDPSTLSRWAPSKLSRATRILRAKTPSDLSFLKGFLQLVFARSA
jgi:hypothetical protein